MHRVRDEQALLLLLKSPKKKYIKLLVESAACLNLCHNAPPPHFKTPSLQSFQSDLELTTEQSHRLLAALSQLVQLACVINFDFASTSIFSQQFDQQLGTILTSTLTSLQPQIEQARANSMRVGNKLVDFNWRLDLQVASEAGNSSAPHVVMEIESATGSELQVSRVQMRGQQFMAFFGNLKKIRENLLELVDQSKQAQ